MNYDRVRTGSHSVRTRIAILEFESESDSPPIMGPNRVNLTARTSLVSLCHLGLDQAAPAHNQPVTGAALWHRVAPNSATAGACRSNLAARLGNATLRPGRLSKPSECPGSKLAHRSSQAAQQAQASESLAHTQQTLDARASKPSPATCKQA